MRLIASVRQHVNIISRLFGRRPDSIPDILSRTEEGFVDLTFGIVGRAKDGSGAWHFHVRALHLEQASAKRTAGSASIRALSFARRGQRAHSATP